MSVVASERNGPVGDLGVRSLPAWRIGVRWSRQKRIAAFLLVVAVAMSAHAQSPAWKPEKNVEIVAGVSAGGNMDRTARAIQAIFQNKKLIPSTSTVINKPGGGQALGLQYVMRHEGDAHYLSVNAEPLLTNKIAGSSPISYTDFTPIAHLFNEYIAFAVRADSPLKTGRDLVERFKAEPNSLSVGVGAALGNVTHIALALLAGDIKADVKKVRIPIFNSGGETITALLGGHVDLVVLNAANLVRLGQKVRLLAISSPQRLPGILSSVPTWRELGHDVTFSSFRVVVAPKRLTPAQISFWDHVFSILVEDNEWKQDMERFYWVTNYLNSAKTGEFLRQRDQELKKVFLEIGLAR